MAQNLIDFLLKNKIKQADLRILKYFSEQKKKIKIGNIDKGCNINYYQAKGLVPKLKKLGLIIGDNDDGYLINNENDLIKILFTKK